MTAQHKKLLLIFFALLCAAGIVIGLWKAGVFRREADARPAVAAIKQRIKMGELIDNVTRLDDVKAEGPKVVYVLTILSSREDALDRAGLMNATLGESACKSNEYMALFRQGLGIEMSYFDLDGKPVQKVAVKPEECGVEP